ncbi:uncharacterized protein At3g27210-like [Typha latifolia]|uniref:uncharacterized protein At3g27210-like n=1 Tax=Typha latifolia TaxID=4733 RepID=UPI003C3091E9
MRFLTGRGSKKAKRNSIPLPPKEKSLNREDPNEELGSKIKPMGSDGGCRSTEFGSKDETFFEARQSLGSDWEDDFFSVNGDFTPSRGNTPNHQIMTPRRSQHNKASIVAIPPGPETKPSPTDKKLKLSELLQEREEDEQQRINHNNINSMEKINNADAEYREVSPDINMKQKKEKSLKSRQCCLPTFARRRGETIHKQT